MTYDAIIVGGGPAGLFLACEMRLAGATPLVLEQRTEPDTSDKAHGLAGQTVRLLDHRGLVQHLGGPDVPRPAPGFFYAGIPLALSTLGGENPLYLLPVNQRDLERVLTERAAELNVEIRRGWKVTSLSQTTDHVQVQALAPDGETTLCGQYLVACDGGSSLIRRQAGIGFPGTTDEHTVDRSALIGPSDHIAFLPGGRVVVEGLGEISAAFHRTEHGVFSILPHDPQRPLVNTAEWEDEPGGNFPGHGDPMTLNEMEDSVERVLGVRVPLTPPPVGAPTLLRRLTHRNSRQADRYRAGRVFVAGDAAHVSHGPTLNAALGDAANLGWKLAASVHGWAPEGLLDTYESERHSVGARVLMHTRAESALLAPGDDVTALRKMATEFLQDPDNLQALAALIAGADVRYHVDDEDPESPAGWFAPPLEMTTGDGMLVRLAELQRDGRPLLIDGTDTAAMSTIVEPWSSRIHYVAAKLSDPPAMGLLVRPDGYIAWTGTDPAGLTAALENWFGAA